MQKYIQEKYNFSNYQMRQLEYLYKTIVSELSKIVILLLIFRDNLNFCLFTIVILSLLRTATGGIHFNTYQGCLIATIIFFYLGIVILPTLHIIKPISICLLCICGFVNYIIAPITAKGHLELRTTTIKRSKIKAFVVVQAYAIAMYIIPENQYLKVGFWIIILQTFQLVIAKIQKTKEVKHHEKISI